MIRNYLNNKKKKIGNKNKLGQLCNMNFEFTSFYSYFINFQTHDAKDCDSMRIPD